MNDFSRSKKQFTLLYNRSSHRNFEGQILKENCYDDSNRVALVSVLQKNNMSPIETSRNAQQNIEALKVITTFIMPLNNRILFYRSFIFPI
jgi:hypothetical protein